MQDKQISSELIYRGVDSLVILSTLFVTYLYTDNYYPEGYLIAGLASIIFFSLVSRFTDIYSSWTARPFTEEILHIVSVWLISYLILIFITFMTKTSAHFSRVALSSWLLFTPVLLVMARYALRRLFSYLKILGLNNHTVVIAGMTEHGLRFAKELESNPDFGYQVAGFYGDDKSPLYAKIKKHYPILGNYNELIQVARRGEWDQVYLALPIESKKRITNILDRLADTATPIRMLPDYFTSNLLKSKYLEIINTPVLSIYDSPLTAKNAFIKRAEDILVGSTILTLITPIMLIIAIAIKLTSKGPILFKQYRYGLKGEQIEVWKFRTMNVCENGQKVTQATRNDHRITKVGKFLRKTSLDELPQFINVLTGKMSIVGPRPHAVVHNEEYRELIPGYMLRHLVKPGITGWAQINGWRGETDNLYKMRKRLEFDLEYMREWTLWLDIKIIIFTIFRGFTDKNAY
ncbi:MAG TPA: undecaprenyl-phosphate glucose phosphotransferase [Thiotrichaceae bacterium]|nr:undecaprenyl-phosphate glucose phosphotransferase [Thiotrichaceae bacterium]